MQFAIEYGVLKKAIGNDRTIVIPEGVRKIANSAIRISSPVYEIVFPSSLREIENGGILNSNGAPIKRLIFNEGLETLQNRSIAADNIEEVYLPSTLKYIGTNNFSSDNLIVLKFGSPYGWYFAGSSGVYKPVDFSLSDPYANAAYYSGRKNPPGIYGLVFYYLKKY